MAKPKYVKCQKCWARNDRIGGRRKCFACGAPLPKRRVPKHAEVLRDTPFEQFARLSQEIHGGNLYDCGCCGRSPKDARNMDRDHGHDPRESSYGKARGLACPGDWGCNKLMSRLTLEKARQIVAYLERVEAHYAAVTVDA
jgi:hypothetical protein